MAADNSPPRIQPIIITAFVAVLVLVGLKFVFDSYYIEMFEAEQYRQIGSVEPAELLALRAAEKKSFAAAPIPIDRAMALVARGRTEPMPGGKEGDITPEPSTDYAALVGWAQLAKPAFVVPAAAPSAAPAPTGSAPAASGSAAVAVPTAPSGAVVRPHTIAPRASAVPAAPSSVAPATPKASASAKPRSPAASPSAKP
jgi:hypothetical protein